MFELSQEEFDNLRTQIASSKSGGNRYMPFAFTEHGVAMLASILNSPKAIEINIQIVRAFVLIRQYAIVHKDLMEKLKEIESKYNKQFKDVYEALNYLLKKDKEEIQYTNRTKIGFKRQNEKE